MNFRIGIIGGRRRERVKLAPGVHQSDMSEVLDHAGLMPQPRPTFPSVTEHPTFLRRIYCRYILTHDIKAEFIQVGDRWRWRYWCERCRSRLKGPE